MPIGTPELIIVLVIALIIFGPKKLPDLGRSLGSGMREFKNSITGGSKDEDGDDDAAEIAPVADKPAATTAPAADKPAATSASVADKLAGEPAPVADEPTGEPASPADKPAGKPAAAAPRDAE